MNLENMSKISGLIVLTLLLFKLWVSPIEVVDKTNIKIIKLENKISDLEKRLDEKPTLPDYNITIFFGMFILGLSGIAITLLIIDYKKTRGDKNTRR